MAFLKTLAEQRSSFTAQELYRIEKVIKKGKNKSLVKWKGYSDEFNSWVDSEDIKNISV